MLQIFRTRSISLLISIILVFGIVVPALRFWDRLTSYMHPPEIRNITEQSSWQCSVADANKGVGTFTLARSYTDNEIQLVWARYDWSARATDLLIKKFTEPGLRVVLEDSTALSHLKHFAYQKDAQGRSFFLVVDQSVRVLRLDSSGAWSENLLLTNSDGIPAYDWPQLVFDGSGTVAAVFVSMHHSATPGVYVAFSEDNGETWGAVRYLTAIPYTYPNDMPTMAFMDSKIYLAYGGVLYEKRRDEPEEQWQAVIKTDVHSLVNDRAGRVYVSRQRDVVTEDSTGVNGGMQYGYSRIGYHTFMNGKKENWVPYAIHEQPFPFAQSIPSIHQSGTSALNTILYNKQTTLKAIDAYRDVVTVVFTTTEPDPLRQDIFVVFSLDSGRTWSTPTLVQSVFGIVYEADVVTDDAAINIAWKECNQVSEATRANCATVPTLNVCSTKFVK